MTRVAGVAVAAPRGDGRPLDDERLRTDDGERTTARVPERCSTI